jgi:mRNA-degrading endonuclease RelE of RelBE toxin-antitoxin system
MSIAVRFKRSFLQSFYKLPDEKQRLVVKAVEAVKIYLESGRAPYGLRIKKLSQSTFEARITIDMRLVWVSCGGEVIFALLGNHDDVRRFIRNL